MCMYECIDRITVCVTVCRRLGTERSALVCIYMHRYIYIYMYIRIIYLLCTYTYACTHACMYVRTHCAHRYRYVSVPRQMPRLHVDSIAVHSSIDIHSSRVYGHPSIFRYMYFGAAPRRACGRAFPPGARAGALACGCICVRVQSPVPYAPAGLSRACGCAGVHAV